MDSKGPIVIAGGTALLGSLLMTATSATADPSVGRGEAAAVTVANAVATAASPKACPLKINYVKPVLERRGRYPLVRNVETSNRCVTVKPIVVCRPITPSPAGAITYCRATTRANGRIVVTVTATGKIRVRAAIRVTPKPSARGAFTSTTVNAGWVLRTAQGDGEHVNP